MNISQLWEQTKTQAPFSMDLLDKDLQSCVDKGDDVFDHLDLRFFLEESFSVQIAPGQKPFQNLQTILEFLFTASIPK